MIDEAIIIQKSKETQLNTEEKISIILKSIFSLAFPKSVISSFAHYLFEHVYWKTQLNHKGIYRVHPKASVRNAYNIVFGYDVRITLNCIIWAGEKSMIKLGDNVLIGPGAQLHATNHGHKVENGPMTYQKRIEKDIVLGNNVWVGGNSIITAGVELADGIIVAAGSTVTKSFDEQNIIIGGVPAKKIAKRI